MDIADKLVEDDRVGNMNSAAAEDTRPAMGSRLRETWQRSTAADPMGVDG